MAKAVLLAINAKYVHSALAPWCLYAAAARYATREHVVTVVESTINQPVRDIAELAASAEPSVLGIGAYIWNAALLPPLMAVLREKLPNTVIVIGGPEATHNAEYFLTRGADFVLCGEGEKSFATLLDALDANAGTSEVPGLARLDCGLLTVNHTPQPDNEWISPYSDSYFDALGNRIAYIETSRGCPFRCAFCLSGTGGGVRFLPIDSAKKRILELSKSGTRTVKFVDRTFNCNAERAFELFDYVIGLDTTCRFHFEVAADLFDEHTLELLKSAPPGRIQLETGLQSFYEPALAAASRQTDLNKAQRNITSILKGGNIHLHADLIAGLPYESFDEFKRSFDRAYALGTHTLQLGFLKLLHGSRLREQAAKLGIEYSDEPPYEVVRSPWLSTEELSALKQAENALNNTYNKSRFLTALRYVLSSTGKAPFSLYHELGAAVPNCGLHAVEYAQGLFDFCLKLEGVRKTELLDCFIIDWLSAFRGKNLPDFLKIRDFGLKSMTKSAEALLRRKIQRGETAMLSKGNVILVDSMSRDPVTGLYELYFAEDGVFRKKMV